MQNLNQICTDIRRFFPPLWSICLGAMINEEKAFSPSTFTHVQTTSIWTPWLSPFSQHQSKGCPHLQFPPLLLILTCGILVASKSEMWIHQYFYLKEFSPDEDEPINTYRYNRSSEKSVLTGNSTRISWKLFLQCYLKNLSWF